MTGMRYKLEKERREFYKSCAEVIQSIASDRMSPEYMRPEIFASAKTGKMPI